MSHNHWDQVAGIHHHGIALPLSALHTAKSSGIGEIFDLLPVLEWMNKVGFDTMQLLPLTDSGADSSPYSALCSSALNPIFLSLDDLPYRKEAPPTFTSESRFHYSWVREGKIAWIKRYLKDAAKSLREEKEYTEFLESTPWIHSYGKFVALKQKNNNKPWWDWSSFEVSEDEIKEQVLIQYLLDGQLKVVAAEAKKRGIFLLGDGPILMNRDSVECFEHRPLFLQDSTVGVPPDYFNQEGQAWGFPPFNWHEIHRENYPFLKERLSSAGRYFSLFRLDHIIGFFRLWIIPDGKSVKEGFFSPSSEEEYLRQGEYLLRWFSDHSNMLLMGEDLGVIPDEVKLVLKKLYIPGTKVMRWERDWKHGATFIPGDVYEPISLTTLSTHDSETFGEWWELFPHDAAQFAQTFAIQYEEKLTPEIRFKALVASHRTSSTFHINPLQEYLSLKEKWSFERSSLERVNIPGTVSPFNWTLRFIPSVEEWTQDPDFAKKMSYLSSRS